MDKVCNLRWFFLCGLFCSLPSPQNLRKRFANLKAYVPYTIRNKGFSGMFLLLTTRVVSDSFLIFIHQILLFQALLSFVMIFPLHSCL